MCGLELDCDESSGSNSLLHLWSNSKVQLIDPFSAVRHNNYGISDVEAGIAVGYLPPFSSYNTRHKNLFFQPGSVISPKELCCNTIVRYVRAMKNQTGAALTVHTIADGQAALSSPPGRRSRERPRSPAETGCLHLPG